MLIQDDSTQNLYNRTAVRWVRGEPSSLSDFTARPAVLELCEPIAGLQVLDLGCGEGYCSRELHRRGASRIDGIDLSEAMIQAAQVQDQEDGYGIAYHVGCATNLPQFADQEFDLVVAVFLFNYLTTTQMQQCMTEVFRILRPGGRFIFSVPHPAFPFMRDPAFPFFFQVEETRYFSDRDEKFPGKIWKRDGTALDVQLVHKTLEDYFNAMQSAGFQTMPILKELRVLPAHVEIDEEFFAPLFDVPLHLAIQVSR